MISDYLANILFFAVAFFFLVYFMLCSSCKEIENILSTFSKKDLTRRNISPWKWKLCVNIYGTEFIQWIYWVRPIEGCFFWYLRGNKTGENFNLGVQINSNTVYRCQFFYNGYYSQEIYNFCTLLTTYTRE